MQDDNQNAPQSNPDQFGMTEKDYKNNQIKKTFETLKYFFAKIEPTIVKIFSTIIYYFIKFTRSVIKSAFEMIKGG